MRTAGPTCGRWGAWVRAWLLAPVIVPVGYLAVGVGVASLVRRPAGVTMPGRSTSVVDLASGMVGPWWLLPMVVLAAAVAVVVSAARGVGATRAAEAAR